jgi:hypothetical protein
MVIRTMTSSDSSGRVPLDFDSRLIPRVAVDVGHGPPEVSLVPPSPVPAFRPPYAEEFFEGAFPDSSPLPWPSPGLNGSALPWPLRVNITTLQGSLHVTDYWGARLSQEDTPLQHLWSPRALGACDVALWRLPRPDLHRLADGDLSRHTRPGLGPVRRCFGRLSSVFFCLGAACVFGHHLCLRTRVVLGYRTLGLDTACGLETPKNKLVPFFPLEGLPPARRA